ncbi:Gfo/Idh/MocA family protein [Alicyclobacillus sp. SO9]|uniref:Gfo/Idh/MocA family protein n=1 Tax=Alicyclobacillus sp. SO9 TaxID=2665646 RepID=UPI0018E87DF3|nr:Gfo/Idh/MocA family oxidoreductase [Alicyclobacillus sp. SO9]QQE77956.1 Gfo/Idh/MocA family oxidoreductase [Alicyclobacillus sp. SO9]
MDLDLNYQPKLPRDKSKKIAIVGAGEIVREAHLPAYKMAGFHVVGITDSVQLRAEQLAERYAIPKVYQSVEDLVADTDVEIVDIAVGASSQPSIVESVVAAGKHVLCQKPLGETYAMAKHIVNMCSAVGVKAAVNQQMRWAPGIAATRTIVERGWLGQLTQATIQVNVHTAFEHWPFLRQIDTLEVMYHSIHYMDAIRYLLGTPEYIYADGARYPGQVSHGETRTMIHMKFPGELRALIHDNHNNWADESDWYATFRFEGTDGIVKGTNGALYNYPQGQEDTLSFLSKELHPDFWFRPILKGKWFPHAFMGTMGELMRAVEENREPSNSVADNLKTLQMVFAAYLSMDENRPVWLSEIQ